MRGRSNLNLTPDDIMMNLEIRGLLGLVEPILSRSNVALFEICGRRRYPRVVRARDEVFHTIRASDPEAWSYPEIADIFGMDHTSVLSAVKRHIHRNSLGYDDVDVKKKVPAYASGSVVAASVRG